MTRLEDRQILVRDIEQARADGARLAPSCALAGIDARTLRRWKAGDGLQQGDRRPDADRPIPSHALSEAEQARIIEIANEPRFAERGLSFELVERFDWQTAEVKQDTRFNYGEIWLQVFALLDGRLHVAVVTPSGNDLRVISLRKANKREVKQYGKKEG